VVLREGFIPCPETICSGSRLIQEWAPRVGDDERELVRQCLDGNQDACAGLVQQYAAMVGTVIWRATADHALVEDLAQETFLRVFRGLRYFDARAKLSTWIYTIAHRVAIDHLRQVRLKADTTADRLGPSRGADLNGPRVADLSQTMVAPERDPEATAAHNELDRIVRGELAALPEKYRLPLVYAAIDELDYQTIAAMLKVKSGTVKTLVFRARQLLRERVELVLAQRSRGTHAT
jgi:RNA polymerase sigma-70 factor (ECF subfamily)